MNDHRHDVIARKRQGYSGPVGPDAIHFLDHHHGDGEHHHHPTAHEPDALDDLLWHKDNIELTTVGIDIGSATSHLMFARVYLHRLAQSLSSRFVVVRRDVLYRSEILLTPFLEDGTIDADALGRFIQGSYRAASITPADIDSGAVLLTGEAIKRRNARAIAALFAGQAGKLVCASAGHHMESALAAHGSGAAALSRRERTRILNVDIGGGTTKLALIEQGELRATAALAVGGRSLVRDAAGRLTRRDESAAVAARLMGLDLELGAVLDSGAVDMLAAAFAGAVLATIGQIPNTLAESLRLTAPLPPLGELDAVTFSGGLAEYLYGRSDADYGDIARPLAHHIRAGLAVGDVPATLRELPEGIRATVIGASQFSVQASGNTIHVSPGTPLPLRNVPVLIPAITLDETVEPAAIAAEVRCCLALVEDTAPAAVALALRWTGDPLHRRLHALAAGIAQGLAERAPATLVLLLDADVGRLLGRILTDELGFSGPLVCIDDLTLEELDFVDVGEVIEPAGVVPIVIKSLIFHHE